MSHMTGRPTITIVEDDHAIREATGMLLEFSGYSVNSFESLRALRSAEAGHPDLYLVDRHLGAENGLSFCAEVKGDAEHQHVPVVIMSASPETYNAAMEAGCDGFLAKPFSRKQLQAVIDRFLKSSDNNS